MTEDSSRQIKLVLNVIMLSLIFICFINLGRIAFRVYGVFPFLNVFPGGLTSPSTFRMVLFVFTLFYFLFYRERPSVKLSLQSLIIEHLFIGFTITLGLLLDEYFIKDTGKLYANLLYIFVLPLSLKRIRDLYPFLAFSFHNDIQGKDKSNKDEFFPLDHKPIETEYSFSFQASTGKTKGYINLVNPFQGIAVVGGGGAGKTFSVINPILRELPQKNYAAFVYDYKYPEQSNVLYRAWLKARSKSDVKFYVVNFTDLKKSNRFNPLSPEVIENRIFCQEYCEVLLKNLNPDWIRRPDFWYTEAHSITVAALWFLKRNAPEFCTLPHLTTLLLHKITDTIALIQNDEDCSELVSSIAGSIERNAEGQVSGTESSYQNPFKKINSEEIFWVLTGNDFNLDLNNPDQPKYLCIGNNEELRLSLNPIISLVATVAIKLMNKEGKRHSIFAADEIPTLYIPNLEMLPATARSRKIVTMLGFQDYALIEEKWGKEKARSLNANLGNQIIGMVSDVQTAEMVSKYFGHDDFKKVSHSYSDNDSYTVSTQRQNVMEVKDIATQKRGHFVGKTTEGKLFSAKIIAEDCKEKDINIPIVSNLLQGENITDIISQNFYRVKDEVKGLMKKYQDKACYELVEIFKMGENDMLNTYIKKGQLKINRSNSILTFKGYTFTFEEAGYSA